MIGKLAVTLSLLWPALGFLTAACLVLLPRHALTRLGPPRVSIFDFVIFENIIPIAVYRFLFLLAALAFLAMPAFRDYSTYFPERLRVEAYYDDEGIGAALAQFGTDELSSLRLAEDWVKRKEMYFALLNQELARANVAFRFDDQGATTSSTGEATFESSMIDIGIQTYRIDKSRGSLKHTTQNKDNTFQTILSEFELIDTPNRIIRVSMLDVYIDHSIVIVPMFKQVFRISPTQELVYDFVSVAAKVYLLPPDIGWSVYFVKGDDGMLFPVGYATYAP